MACTTCTPLTKTLDSFHLVELADSPLDAHVWLYDYRDVADVVRKAKYAKESIHYQHFAPLLARALTSYVSPSDSVFVSFVPTIASHLHARGKDHAHMLASHISRYSGISLVSALIPTHDKAQVSSTSAFRRRNPHYLATGIFLGATIIVVDDTATTRTTLENAARALKTGGARRVIAGTLAYRSLHP